MPETLYPSTSHSGAAFVIAPPSGKGKLCRRGVRLRICRCLPARKRQDSLWTQMKRKGMSWDRSDALRPSMFIRRDYIRLGNKAENLRGKK